MPFFISNGLNEAQEDTSFVSQLGVEQSFLLGSGLARSIVSRVIGTLHFASCIVAGKKQCVNIFKKKLPDQYLRLWLFSLLVYQSPYYAWLSVFSQLLQLDPNLIGELFWLATTAQKQSTEVSSAQSIPSVHIPLRVFVGHLSFCFGKATNAPRWGRAFKPKPHGGY